MKQLFLLLLFTWTTNSYCFAQLDLPMQSNDSIRLEYKLVNENDSLYERRMYKHDVLVEHMFLKNKQMIGAYKSYYDNGDRLIEGAYDKNGKAIGEWRRYYLGGNLASKVHYADGGLSGLCYFYYPNGKVKEFGNYNTEKYELIISGAKVPHLVETKIGIWETYHDTGGIKSKGEYWFDALPMRSPEEMLEAIESMETGEFMKPWTVDIKHGKWQYWDEKGALSKEEIYEKGELLEMIRKKR